MLAAGLLLAIIARIRQVETAADQGYFEDIGHRRSDPP
jgi:hypothetical protein